MDAIPILTSIITSALTWLAMEFFLKPWIRPKLTITFNPDDNFCKLDYSLDQQSVFYRVKVTSVRPTSAKHVRVYLMNVELVDHDKVTRSEYQDGPLPLAWAYEVRPEGQIDTLCRQTDLPLMNDTPAFADVCYVRRGGDATIGFLAHPYNKYLNLIQKNKRYLLTLQAVAEEAKPARCRLSVTWGGTADTLNVQLEP